MTLRTIDPEHNWFWQQGHQDGFDGLRAILPDEARRSFERSDYFAGYEAGQEDRGDRVERCAACGVPKESWLVCDRFECPRLKLPEAG